MSYSCRVRVRATTRYSAFLLFALSAACGEDPVETEPVGVPGPHQIPERPGHAAPPISGGTLLVTRDGRWAVAADPDLDRVLIVGISADTPGCNTCQSSPKLLADIGLPQGDEPGRLAEDGDGRIHVVLRRGSAIGTIDPAEGSLLARRPVCAAPRGLTYDENAKLLHVACASGELVSLEPASGTVTRSITLDADLRDVVVVPEGLVVSRFKSAQLIRLDRQGNVLARVAPAAIERAQLDQSEPTTDPLEGGVAWRTVATAAGGVLMLHQYARTLPITLGTPLSPSPAPYRARSECGGIVAQGVSALSPGSGELEMGLPLPVVALSVDVAASSDGQWLAVAHPGRKTNGVTLYRSEMLPTLGRSPVVCAESAGQVVVEGQPVAVATLPGRVPVAVPKSDWLVVQTRVPPQLLFFGGLSGPRAKVLLREPQRHAGHDLFHRDGGSGIACAQCHPEGGEDGRVWKFVPLGLRRTQAVNVGLESTAPFHWDGAFPNLEDLVSEFFERKMGLAKPSDFALVSIEQWLFSLRPPPTMADPSSEPVARGRALFESAEVGCTKCHAGSAVADNASFDVGVEPPLTFQVPSLRGVAYRAPFLHNGCARTLRERFDAPCGGGDAHGQTSQLSAAQIDDLVAYLKSL